MRTRRRSLSQFTRRSTRGTVLVIVLVTLLFAAAALVAFIDKASIDLIVESREATADRLRPEAYSALNVTLAVLEDFRLVNGGLRSEAEGWGDPLGFAGWSPREGCTAEVTFRDESAKLSLPNVESAALLNLFEAWGLPRSDAERLTDALFSWMRKDYVPASSWSADYDRGAIPYEAPLRSLRSYSELAAIDVARELFYDEEGRPNELWHRFVDAVSLLDFEQSNLNGANGDVLSAMGVSDPMQQKQITDFLLGTGSRERLGPAFFDSPEEAARLVGAGALPPSAGTTISALRINVLIREGRTTFQLSAVVTPSSGGAKLVPRSEVNAEKSPSADPSADAPAAARKTASGEQPKKLNYPFTLLEIAENAEIPTAPPEPTQE